MIDIVVDIDVDVVIAIVTGWFVALVISFGIWGIIELFKGFGRLISLQNKKNA